LARERPGERRPVEANGVDCGHAPRQEDFGLTSSYVAGEKLILEADGNAAASTVVEVPESSFVVRRIDGTNAVEQRLERPTVARIGAVRV
jgi:hypothetical protein